MHCRHLPLARDLVRLSRQQLVHRLDSYMSKRNLPIFKVQPGGARKPAIRWRIAADLPGFLEQNHASVRCAPIEHQRTVLMSYLLMR